LNKNNFIKFTDGFQKQWANNHFFDQTVLNNIDKEVQLHNQVSNVKSSAASCINVLGNLGKKENMDDLITFLNSFGLNVTSIIPFPTGVVVSDEKYNDIGNVVFEWIGPKTSPINEKGGKRGQNRTSIDAFVLAEIGGKITQIFIEWKFTETYQREDFIHKFSGGKGIERLARYSNILAEWRREKELPFKISDNDILGFYDFGYEPFYQLFRMTLLAKRTTPLSWSNEMNIEDYRILHLTHSKNIELNKLCQNHIKYSPGLQAFKDEEIHAVWKDQILTTDEAEKFIGGYWNEAVHHIKSGILKSYLTERYC
jgi:hypothetical protein